MQVDVRAAMADCDHVSNRASRGSRLNKFAVAGATMVTAGALAIAPVTVTPPAPTAGIAAAPVALSAFQNPLTQWATTISNSLLSAGGLGNNIVAASATLNETLGNSALQAEIIESLVGTLGNPGAVLRQVFAFPTTYGDRISAALAASGAASEDAFSKLPTVLAASIGHLLRGEFLLAFGELNYWFLTDGLSDGRGSLLDAMRIPGDFLESIGLDPLARILGTSWMDEGTAGPGYGPGLLSRAVIGNFGRALLAPAVTAVFQTVEILDNAREALVTGDLVTLASEVLNAPARILNAFLNGYVPEFITDPDSPYPPGPGQSFPGLLSPTGTFDFFFVQIPQQIARALKMEKPADAASASTAAVPASVADSTVAAETDAVTLDLVSSDAGSAAVGQSPAGGVVVDDQDDTAQETVDEADEADATEDSDAADEAAAEDSTREDSEGRTSRKPAADRASASTGDTADSTSASTDSGGDNGAGSESSGGSDSE